MIINVKHNLRKGQKFNPSIVTPLLVRVIQPTDRDTKPAISYMSHTQLLLTQEKLLSRLGPDNVRAYIDSILPKGDALKNKVNSKASVDDLLLTCKSRYCQSLGDLQLWNDYLTDLHKDKQTEVDNIMQEAKERAEAQKKQETETNSE